MGIGDGQLKGHKIAFHLNFAFKGRHVRRSFQRRKVKRPDEFRTKTSKQALKTNCATLLK